MYASFTPTGAAAVALSDSTNVREDMVLLDDSSEKQLQPYQPLRAQFGGTFDRGNQLTKLRWRTTKKFTTTDAGFAWLQATRAAVSCVGCVPPSGTLTLTIRNADRSTKSATVSNANLQIRLSHGSSDSFGVSFCFEFDCQGGALSAYA